MNRRGMSGLMAHELAHTIQQTSGTKLNAGISSPGDPLEREADRVAEAAVSGGSADVTAGTSQQIMRDVASDVTKLMSIRIFGWAWKVDWAVTDAEANQALGLLSNLPMDRLKDTLARIDRPSRERFHDNLPDSSKDARYGKVVVASLIQFGRADLSVDHHMAMASYRFLDSQLPVDQEKLGKELRSSLRKLFDATPNTELAALQTWAKLRFEKPFGKANDPQGSDWSKHGLQRTWDVLEVLPEEHVAANASLSAINRYNEPGDISGWANNAGEVGIGYDNSSDLLAPESTEPGDPLEGANAFDVLVRHEIGHRVFPNVNGAAHCRSRQGGGWLVYDGSDHTPREGAEQLVASSGGVINSWPDNGEKRQIIDALGRALGGPNTVDVELDALSFYPEDLAKKADIDGDNAVWVVRNSTADDQPWWDSDHRRTLNGRIYQEAYEQTWVSYDAAARQRKVSAYQFRSPWEWFAEAYAAYYDPSHEVRGRFNNRDLENVRWFIRNVHNIGP